MIFEPLRIFIGYDPRQPVAYNVLQYSILANASVPVAITPLVLRTLPLKRAGLTEFTYSRYLVPFLCDYKGVALFLDADMVVEADIAELFLQIHTTGVTVCNTKLAFERPSAMLFHCDLCKELSPKFIKQGTPQNLESWSEGGVSYFPSEWNYCVGYDHDDNPPKLIHYTAGLPVWPETANCRHAAVWHKYHRAMNSSVLYADLMAQSVHHKKVISGEINQ